MSTYKPVRLAVRAIIVENSRLLLVNAYAGQKSDLWCAPGGGVDPGASLPDNLKREVFEETGLAIDVGQPCLVNEFHDPKRGFHQVDIYFRCQITDGTLDEDWQDPEQIVNRRRFFSQTDLETIRFKPDSLPAVAFSDSVVYDPLELIVP
ncbi:NUDIX hydrolase [Roseovarius sp. EL26]|uniref:NUDIX domain-containing protein n=1 Tax=Roseovarius sp. EL26 TaxID=2126672 RepID=UPI000EA1B804|nr:NUDIX hydrolase [Roseovarius sp. EL26]